MKKLLIYIYYYCSLLKIFICYDKEQIQFMYDTGLLGTKEGRMLKRIFHK